MTESEASESLQLGNLVTVYGKKRDDPGERIVFRTIRYADYLKRGKTNAESQGYHDFRLKVVLSYDGGIASWR